MAARFGRAAGCVWLTSLSQVICCAVMLALITISMERIQPRDTPQDGQSAAEPLAIKPRDSASGQWKMLRRLR
jgi:hypothetical protein